MTQRDIDKAVVTVGWLIASIIVAIFVLSNMGCTAIKESIDKQLEPVPELGHHTTPTSLPTATPRPKVALAWDGKHPDAAKWTDYCIDTVGKMPMVDIVPTDFKKFPAGKIERSVFWCQLLSKMAQYESNYKPETIYKECSKDKAKYKDAKWFESEKAYCIGGSKLDGGVAISRGLFQISIQSANSYGANLTDPKKLHGPLTNIWAAILILNRWVVKDKVVAIDKLGCARYWSVCRPHSDSKPKIMNYMKELYG